MILLLILLFSAVWTVMTARLLRSVVGLAMTSAILAIVMYRLSSGLAAVFELSVCSGLISVIFITTVSFTRRLSKESADIRKRERMARFWYLPFLLLAAGICLIQFLKIPKIYFTSVIEPIDVRALIWHNRHLDLFGQVIILLAGVFGVVILFKEQKDGS